MKILLLTIITIINIAICYSQGNYTNKTSSSLNLEWKSRGPDNIGGTTKAVLWDNSDENILYAGGILSGMFKSYDKGQHWEPLTSYYGNNPGIISIAQSVNGTIFVGTGQILGNTQGYLSEFSTLGNGIYKSSDEGSTWTHLDNTSVISSFLWSNVYEMACSPTNSNILIASTRNGAVISTNAESSQPTFTQLNISPSAVTDIVFAANGNTVFIATNGRIYKSTDVTNNFTTWTDVSPLGGSSRSQVTVSSIDNTGNFITYVSTTSGSGCLSGIFKSIDGGNNWTQIVFPDANLDPFKFNSFGCQGWYDNALKVNPYDSDKLYIAGVTLYLWSPSTGMVLLDDIYNPTASNYIGNDKHEIIFNPHNHLADEMIIAGDGGLFYSENIRKDLPYDVTFESINNGYNTVLSYNSTLSSNGKILISTYQKGTKFIDYNGSTPYAANSIFAGQNGLCEISNYDEDVFLYSNLYGALKRSINEGSTTQYFLDNTIDPSNCGYMTCFSSPCDGYSYAQSYTNYPYLYESEYNSKLFITSSCPNLFFICTNPFDKINPPNFSSIYLTGSSQIIGMDCTDDGDKLYGVGGTYLWTIKGLNNFTPTIPNDIMANTTQLTIDTFNLQSLGVNYLSAVAVDQNNDDHIIITQNRYGGINKLFSSADGGLTWDSIQNNLPIMPIYDCIIDIANSDRYILATEKGIWASDDRGITWNSENNGINGSIPINRIRQEWVIEDDCYLLVATSKGSGTFTSSTLKTCNTDVDDIVWGHIISINSSEKYSNKISIYPNPSNDEIKIEFDFLKTKLNFIVYDILGKEVFRNSMENFSNEKNILTIDISNFNKGMYFLSIQTKGKIYSKTFVKN